MSLASDVAKAALIEAGRPDLAVLVRESRQPNSPTHDHTRSDDPMLVRKAFLLGHQTHDRTAFIDEDTAIVCPTCDANEPKAPAESLVARPDPKEE